MCSWTAQNLTRGALRTKCRRNTTWKKHNKGLQLLAYMLQTNLRASLACSTLEIRSVICGVGRKSVSCSVSTSDESNNRKLSRHPGAAGPNQLCQSSASALRKIQSAGAKDTSPARAGKAKKNRTSAVGAAHFFWHRTQRHQTNAHYPREPRHTHRARFSPTKLFACMIPSLKLIRKK